MYGESNKAYCQSKVNDLNTNTQGQKLILQFSKKKNKKCQTSVNSSIHEYRRKFLQNDVVKYYNEIEITQLTLRFKDGLSFILSTHLPE